MWSLCSRGTRVLQNQCCANQGKAQSLLLCASNSNTPTDMIVRCDQTLLIFKYHQNPRSLNRKLCHRLDITRKSASHTVGNAEQQCHSCSLQAAAATGTRAHSCCMQPAPYQCQHPGVALAEQGSGPRVDGSCHLVTLRQSLHLRCRQCRPQTPESARGAVQDANTRKVN